MSVKQNKKQSKNKKTALRVLLLIRNYWPLLILSIVMAIVTTICQLFVPILIGWSIDCIVGAGAVDFSALQGNLFRLLLVVIAAAITQWIMNASNNHITFHVVTDVRNRVFSHLEQLPLRYVDTHQHGDIVSRVISDADQFSDGLLMGFTQLFTGVMTIVGTLVFMLIINVKIALLVVVITPLSLFVASFIAKNTYSMSKRMASTRGELTGYINEMIGNQPVVKAFGYEKEAIDHFNEINTRLQEHSLKATFFSSLTNPSTRFVNNVVYAGVACYGAFTAIAGGITIGNLSSFLSYANQYTKPFNEISGVVTELQNALACAARVFELLDEEPLTPDAPDAIRLENPSGLVELKNVRFSYNPEQNLIKNFSLRVEPGQRIAIVGPTGCGKTTIINLLMRFYDVCDGSVSVDGTDLRNITRESLRKNFGMVLQETWLKADTIRANIAYGKPEASEEEIIQAAKKAHAHSFIQRMPQGYDTVITEDGGNLSQGQKQLLCIARVMLSLPPMLILDEATSSIDTRTEIRIQKAFSEMMKGRTSFIVAHRLSTIREADQILVMKDGDIIEQGNHETLLKQNGFYEKLYHSK